MSEILQIFQHSPPPYHQMPHHIQRGLVNYDSQYTRSIDSGSPSPDIFDGADNFRCSEFADNPFMNFSSSSVDELSKVTAIIGHNQSSKKRKLEFDNVDIGLHEPHRTKKDTPDGNSKPKPDYIHVRARRGEATDSHSIAERARREKIKKKMQDLQDLVPGCNKIANRAAILDEIIFYVQSLQMEVEFLTMQLNASTTSLSQLLEGQLIS